VNESATLTIGEIARRTGVATSTLRYYESIGLLPKAVRQSGQRRYDPTTIRAVGFIKLAQHAGFSVNEIGTLLHGFPTDTPPSVRWQELAQNKLKEIETQMARVLEMKRVLEEGLSCGCITIEECSPLCAQTPSRS
jgi:MerR family transcriptional regulator, redox-sensitive transcriptional activator SoxR